MGLIDFILNLAGLLLWLNWRSVSLDPLARTAPATLAGTLRRAGPPRLKRWHFLAALGALILVRALFYCLLGSALDWTPKLDLEFVVLAFRTPAFRSDIFASVLLYSTLSFVHTLIIFYFWLLALAFINRNVAEPDPFQKLIRLHLGGVSRWPRFAQAVLPLFTVAGLWMALHPLLLHAGVVDRVQSNAHLAQQGLLAGLCIYFTLKCLIPAVLFAHIIASYVYFGPGPFWEFIGTTSRNLLGPLRQLPLRVGKVDFAPLVGIVLVLLLLHALPGFALGKFAVWPP